MDKWMEMEEPMDECRNAVRTYADPSSPPPSVVTVDSTSQV